MMKPRNTPPREPETLTPAALEGGAAGAEPAAAEQSPEPVQQLRETTTPRAATPVEKPAKEKSDA